MGTSIIHTWPLLRVSSTLRTPQENNKISLDRIISLKYKNFSFTTRRKKEKLAKTQKVEERLLGCGFCFILFLNVFNKRNENPPSSYHLVTNVPVQSSNVALNTP